MMNETMLTAESLINPKIQANCHVVTSIKHAYPLHYHDYYEIFIITSGKCIHRVNGREQLLGTGTLVFIRPEDAHGYTYYNNMDCQFMNVNFYKELVEECFDFLGDQYFSLKLKTLELPPYIVLPSEDMESLLGKGEQINLYTSIDEDKAKILGKSFLIDALTYLFIDYKNDKNKAIPDWFDLVLFQMQKKENFTAGLDKLFLISQKSTGHLNRTFRQYLNTTPTAYINNLKLNYARNILITTNMDILDVALEAGFENLSHFYHLFREKYGESPGKVRTTQ